VKLTPLEIRKQTFARKRLGGVDPLEVQDFLNQVAAELEEMTRENAILRERRDAAAANLNEYKTMEDTLRRTLVRAERISSESREHAQRESDIVLQQAHLRAERVLEDARSRLRQLTDEIEELNKKKEVFVHRFRSLVKMQLELLDQHREDYDDITRIAESASRATDRYAPPADLGEERGPAGEAEPFAYADEDLLPDDGNDVAGVGRSRDED
jgi:cell division initiation protein